MRRTLFSALLALGLILGLSAPANAAYYGKPSGKWLEAIISHEVGHCLGWWEHRTPTSSSIMRSSLSPSKILAGTQSYRPNSTDLAKMQESRSGSGSRATYYVQNPFHRDMVPIYNRTGLSSAFTAADRWDSGTDFSIWSTSSEPSSGITIFWDNSLAGQSIGGRISVQDWVWSGTEWRIADCTVHLNPKVVT